VEVGSDQCAAVEGQSRQRALTRSRSLSVIAPCWASHSASSRRPASSFNCCSTCGVPLFGFRSGAGESEVRPLAVPTAVGTWRTEPRQLSTERVASREAFLPQYER